MDPEKYLQSLGWKKGEGLKPGSLRKPLLLKHRKDNRGLGFKPHASDAWWERVFDGHLKTLDVSSGSSGVNITVDEEARRKAVSPLYAMFLPGEVLAGTIESSPPEKPSSDSVKVKDKRKKSSSADSSTKSENGEESKHHRRKSSKEKKPKKAKKAKKDKSHNDGSLSAKKDGAKISKKKHKKHKSSSKDAKSD